jgi:hypothetical protein
MVHGIWALSVVNRGEVRDQAAQCEEWIRQATDARQRAFYEVLARYYGHGMDLLRRKADVLGGETAADVIMSTKERDPSASQLVKLGGLIGGVLGGFTRSVS